MPRKIDPCWGVIVPPDPPGFMIGNTQAENLGEFFGVSDEDNIGAIKAAIEEICQLYLARRAQDEEGPTRAERNGALQQLAAADDFVGNLRRLNHRAESALLDALNLYYVRSWKEESGVEGAFYLIEKVKRRAGDLKLDAAIAHMRAAIREHLPRLQSKGGPDYPVNLSLAVDDLLALHHQVTGKAPTHSELQRALYTNSPQSQAGRFVVMVFDLINATLVENNQARILKSRINTEVRRAVRRFKTR